ncbi:MAG: hypothetical protein DA405_08895 [Bacteroidetes bacterium]|nr:MAG: hypothetical protein DA405_08895 [Bacteroidota bacterium]
MYKKLFSLSLAMLTISALSAQSVSVLNPSVGQNGQTLPIIISGQNTSFTQGSVSLILSQGSQILGQGTNTVFSNILAVNNTTISANLSVPGSSTIGFYDLMVNSGSSTINRLSAFEVIPGGQNSISTNSPGAKPGQNLNVTFNVTGASFKNLAAENIEKVWLSKGNAVIANFTNIQVINSTSFSADLSVPAGASQGLWDINVYTSIGNAYRSSATFAIAPDISTKEFESNNFAIYPNPVGDELRVELPASADGLSFRIIDITGKEVAGLERQIEGNILKVKTKTLSTGNYLIQFNKGSKVLATKKLVKS